MPPRRSAESFTSDDDWQAQQARPYCCMWLICRGPDQLQARMLARPLILSIRSGHSGKHVPKGVLGECKRSLCLSPGRQPSAGPAAGRRYTLRAYGPGGLDSRAVTEAQPCQLSRQGRQEGQAQELQLRGCGKHRSTLVCPFMTTAATLLGSCFQLDACRPWPSAATLLYLAIHAAGPRHAGLEAVRPRSCSSPGASLSCSLQR